MGIEPTDRMFFMRPNGFEDRGHHQVCKHFQFSMPSFNGFPADDSLVDCSAVAKPIETKRDAATVV